MQLGVVFPQTEISADRGAVRRYVEGARDLGYSHLLVYDHVVGADTSTRPDWRGPYNLHSMFHEPFVLFGYVGALAPELELVTGILILPQRQTVLVAKQAAEVDVLTGGRFRLGIGVGWNPVEYTALGEDFSNRGRRSEEQIVVLRRLFTEESVTYTGRWHEIPGAGINPLPVQRPIPIWLGGHSDATLRRIARLADGWFTLMDPDAAKDAIREIRRLAADAGRDPDSIGIEARLSVAGAAPEDWRSQYEAWRDVGATHLSINTMNAGLTSPQDHIDVIAQVKEALSY